jgi:hypothetical protein
MKKALALLILMSGVALATSPRDFFDVAASDANWGVPQGRNFCAGIAENGRKGSWPADPKSALKYITTLNYQSYHSAKTTKLDVELMKGIKANQPWHDYSGAYSRLYDGVDSPGYLFNIILADAIDDNGPTGETVVCVGIYSRR